MSGARLLDGSPAAVLSVADVPAAGPRAVATAVKAGGDELLVLSGHEALRSRGAVLQRLAFAAEIGDLAVIPDSTAEVDLWFAFGVGSSPSPDALRRAGQRIGRSDTELEVLEIDLRELPDQAACGAAFVEGFELGLHRSPLARLVGAPAMRLVADETVGEELRELSRVAQVRARAANLARRLADTPPSQLRPADVGELAEQLAQRHGWHSAGLNADALRDAGFGGIDSVSRGSEQPPFLVDVTHRGRGEGEAADLVLIGKGVTMDCGGLNIKWRGASTWTMKADMAGGAAVLAALTAVSELGLELNVRVLVPLAENLPGPRATMPGDVIRHRGGRTTEVTNTDAEGRLLLADALAYAVETSPQADLITVGTLSNTLGPGIIPVVGKDGALASEVIEAMAATAEGGADVRTTRDYEAALRSDVADARNYSWEHGGSVDLINATVFMQPFAGGARWVHVDVAEPSYLTAPWGSWGVGATGVPTRSMVELVARRARKRNDLLEEAK